MQVSASTPGSLPSGRPRAFSASTLRGHIREVVLRGEQSPEEQRLLLYALSYLRRELAWDGVRARAAFKLPEVKISLHDWQHAAASLDGFDRLLASVRKQGDFRLVLSCTDWLAGSHAALEVLNRYQRLLPLPLDYEPLPKLAGVLAVHQLLHGSRPDRYQLDHAQDVWRWLLRLTSGASPGLQLAALFHDAGSDPDPKGGAQPAEWAREERALASVRLACRALEPLALPQPMIMHMSRLILQLDDEREVDDELTLLRDARDLTFFSSTSHRTLDEHGTVQTFTAVTNRLQRMSETAVCLALMTRQPPLIEQIIETTLDARGAADSA